MHILGAAALVVLMLIVCFEVASRYLFKAPTYYALDMAEFLLVTMGFLAASYTLLRGQHVRVDLLISRVSQRTRLILEIVSSLIILSYFVVLVWWGWENGWRAYILKWHTSDLAELPLWPSQMVIPLGGFLLCLAALQLIHLSIRSLRTARK
ncbi:TRAP transporter small permease subunit [Chloroflexota bacterium]